MGSLPVQPLLAIVIAFLIIAVPAPANADAIRDQQWHLSFLKASKLHAITKGKGVTVGVVDTGVDGEHPDLKSNVVEGADFTPRNTEGDGWVDVHGHGTAMASLIGAHGHGPGNGDGVLGLAPEATILPVRNQVQKLRGGDTAAAIRWAVDHGADVINLSFAGGRLEEAVNYAIDRDVVVVAAAGNTTQGDTEVGAPASYPGVIAVSGVDKNGRFSDVSVKGPEVAVAAPATDILSAAAGDRGRYATGRGTSNSAAIVSGVVALIRAKYPDLDAPNVINRLIATADDKGPKGRDDKYGFGVINPVKALTAKVPKVDENPLWREPTDSPTPSYSYTGPPLPGAEGDHKQESTGMSTGLTVVLIVGSVLVVGGVVIAAVVISRQRGPSPGP